MDADPRRRVSDLRIADEACDIFAIEQNAVLVLAGFEADGGFMGQSVELGGGVKRNFGSKGFEGKGAVHGAGFKIQQAEMAGEMARNGAFARTCRAVDGDDDSAGGLGG
jgi:hypothetical protein